MSSIVNQPHSFGEEDGSVGAEVRRSVLVTGAAGASGRSLAEQLIARGLHVHCTDHRSMDVPAAECHLMPPPTDPGFLPSLARLVRTEGIGLVIPANSAALFAISLGREAFGENVEVVMPRPGPTATAHDRLLTAWGLWSHGIAVPDFGVPSDFVGAAARPSFLRGPVIIRPRWVDSEHATVLVDKPAEVDWAALGDDLLVQEFVPGTAYKAVTYRPTSGRGRLTTVLEETIVDDGGELATACAVGTSTVPEVERVAQAAVRALGLTGPVEVSLRVSAGAPPTVLDVRACFGPHSQLVPELLDAVLRDHPERAPGETPQQRSSTTTFGGSRTGRAIPMGALR